MINRLLTMMEENPGAVFQRGYLVSLFPTAFNDAVGSKLLHRVPDQARSIYLKGTRYTVVSNEKGIEAINDENIEDEPISLKPEDLERYTLNLEVFARKIQLENHLTDKTCSINDRLFFLGEAEREGIRIAYILAFINDSPVIQSLLAALPGLIPTSYKSFGVICPSRMPDIKERRQLENIHIRVALIRKEQPYILPDFNETDLESEPAKSDFRHIPESRSILWHGVQYKLTIMQNEVIRILFEAHKKGVPAVPFAQIRERLKNIDRYPGRMSDIFKGLALYGTLIVGDHKGFYHLVI